jgi:hypothetical protein
MFLIYVNDLPSNVEDGQLVLYVEYIHFLIVEWDTNILQHELNEVMKKLEYWFQKIIS